ncbi:hypothetical protein [Methanoregula formicica]|uniref:Uncharacterized protein n=1 Tax=Methanoregula formicica (strain DSM 22288 / NBRC 105244 / SMSP) TaxID=593750 RepID=L0HI64_METFS|nr:hypothetical protein [Methanoregula formicica]AGB03013.1 hypothetical protein Metfor_1999 [Methanoregula formicica SMSP]
MKKFFFFLTKITICVVIIIVVFIAGSDWYIHVNQPGYYQSQYSINIRNLSYYSTDGFITDIIVPIPQLNHEDVFFDESMQGQTFGNWKSVLVATDDGKMLALQSTGNNLSDISASFVTDYRRIGTTRWEINDLSLIPVIEQPDNNGMSQFSHSTTIVYIPRKFSSIHEENSPPITVDIEYIVFGDRTGSDYIDDYQLQGTIVIPEDYSGKIPLAVHAYSRAPIPRDGNITWLRINPESP